MPSSTVSCARSSDRRPERRARARSTRAAAPASRPRSCSSWATRRRASTSRRVSSARRAHAARTPASCRATSRLSPAATGRWTWSSRAAARCRSSRARNGPSPRSRACSGPAGASCSRSSTAGVSTSPGGSRRASRATRSGTASGPARPGAPSRRHSPTVFPWTTPATRRLRLFTRSALHRLLGAHGLTRVRSWGVHGVTNVIPSTVLHRATLGRTTGTLYRGLRALDRALAATPAGRALANSLVVLAMKDER